MKTLTIGPVAAAAKPAEFWQPPGSPLAQAVAAARDLIAGKIKL